MGPAKLQKATDLGVTLLSENDFIKMISQWVKQVFGSKQKALLWSGLTKTSNKCVLL
jgi:BRCT domain type II-containing protein